MCTNRYSTHREFSKNSLLSCTLHEGQIGRDLNGCGTRVTEGSDVYRNDVYKRAQDTCWGHIRGVIIEARLKWVY